MERNEQAYNDLWQPFLGRPFKSHGDPRIRVTLDQKNVFYLNKAAYTALGEVKAVEFMFSDRLRAIGVRPSDLSQESSFPIKHRKKNGLTYGYCIHAAAFMQHHNLRTDRMVQFNKITLMADGMMNLPLTYLTRISKGAK